jgi:hypothetical protein
MLTRAQGTCDIDGAARCTVDLRVRERLGPGYMDVVAVPGLALPLAHAGLGCGGHRRHDSPRLTLIVLKRELLRMRRFGSVCGSRQ